MVWKRVVCPSVCGCLLALSLTRLLSVGNGVAWQRWGQRCACRLKSGPRVLVHRCFTWRDGGCAFTWMRRPGRLWLLSAAEKVCLGSSVYTCAKCVCVCVVCVCVCALGCLCVGVCFSGVLTGELHGICSPPFGNTSLQRGKRERRSFTPSMPRSHFH